MGARLKNNYLVDTLFSTRINDYYFFLMENMELGNLKSFNENEIHNCSELLCSYFIYQCLLALQHMHSNLIVHRDIKLENILINKKYEVKLADFSMCLQLKENTKYPISRSGTIPYLPPESFYSKGKSKSASKNKNNNNNINIILNGNNNNMINNNCNSNYNKKFLSVESSLKKDTFALGIVMYRLLFKEHPFDYEYKMDRETYGKKIKNTLLSFRGKDLTSDCIAFLEGLLKHNVHKRFSINDAINHVWIIKTQKIINTLIKKNVGKNKCNLISLLNNYVYKEDIDNIKNNKIILDFSTKDSEDKEKEKSFIRLKRKRIDEDNNIFNNIE
jgi:serine/threonine protein kinase